MMGGSGSADFLAPAGAGENTLVTCENGDFAADLEVARGVPRAPIFPETLVSHRGGRDARREDVRGAGGVPRDRRRCDLEGDARDDRRRHRRARARARRRPHRAREARRRARPAVAPGDRRGDPRGVRRLRRLARPGRLQGRGRSPTRRCATGSSSPARTATAGTCAASRRAATSSRASPTCASRPRATPARTAAARSLFETAIEVGHIFKLGHALLRAARRDVPRRGRPGAAADHGQLRHRAGARDGGARRAAPRRERHQVARVGRPVRRPHRRSCSAPRRSPPRPPRPCRRPARTCCSTTAICAPARSSPTPT